jgi:hypothetical protein
MPAFVLGQLSARLLIIRVVYTSDQVAAGVVVRVRGLPREGRCGAKV